MNGSQANSVNSKKIKRRLSSLFECTSTRWFEIYLLPTVLIRICKTHKVSAALFIFLQQNYASILKVKIKPLVAAWTTQMKPSP